MFDAIVDRFRALVPNVPFWSMRLVCEETESLAVRRGVADPPWSARDVGAMVTIGEGRGLGYAATPDLTAAGLTRAIDSARQWARRIDGASLIDPSWCAAKPVVVEWASPVQEPWTAWPFRAKLDLLRQLEAGLRSDSRIVDASAATVLRSRWARALVGAAGMLVEVFVAALAFYLWMSVEPATP